MNTDKMCIYFYIIGCIRRMHELACHYFGISMTQFSLISYKAVIHLKHNIRFIKVDRSTVITADVLRRPLIIYFITERGNRQYFYLC